MLKIKEVYSNLISKFKSVDSKYIFYTSYSIIFIAMLIGAFTRLYSVFSYTGFLGDQARDGFFYADMREGNWPTLGPESSIGGYSIPPMYYYLNFILSFGSLDPAMQAFPNALLSFLSIPLLVYFILLLVNGFKSSRSWLIASLAGLWWSVFFNDIVLNNKEWNPNSIPFFLMIFLILCKQILESKTTKNTPILDNKKLITLWSLLGLIVSILIGLHSSTLFIMPAVLIGVTVFYFLKFRTWHFLYAYLVVFLTHTGYILGEIPRRGANTKSLIKLILDRSEESRSLFERFDRVVFNYLELGNLAYFLDNYRGFIASLFLALVLGLAVMKYKGNKTIWVILWSVWILFSYSVSNYWGTIFIHYKMLILFAPIIFTAIYLNYFEIKKVKESILALLIVILSGFSIFSNSYMSYNYMTSIHGAERLVNTYDLESAISKLPNDTNICSSNKNFVVNYGRTFNYISQKVVKPSKNLILHNECQSGFTFFHFKYQSNDNASISLRAINTNTQPNSNNLIFENKAILVYKV